MSTNVGAKASKNSRTIVVPAFRLYWPRLIEAEAYKGGTGAKKFSMGMIFEPDALKKVFVLDDSKDGMSQTDLNQLLAQIAKAEWPGIDLKADLGRNWPVIPGETEAAKLEAKKKNGEYLKGKKLVRASGSEKFPPDLCIYNGEGKNRVKVKLSRKIEDERDQAEALFVGGNYARAALKIVPQEVNGNKFLSIYINEVIFSKVGERIGGMSAIDKFDGIHGGQSDYDPTAGMDDGEIPF